MRPSRTPFTPEFESTIDLSRTTRHEWVESVASHDGTTSLHFLGTSLSSRRISMVFFLITAVTLLFGARAGYLQLFEGSGFALASAAQKERLITVPARRGIIYDREGAILVSNLPRFVLQIDLAELPRDEEARARALEQASTLAQMTQEDVHTRIAAHRYREPLIIRDDIPLPDALVIMVEAEKLPGVSVELQYSREYHNKEAVSLSHVVGYLGRISESEYSERGGTRRLNDMVGRDGLELSYDDVLRGRDGRKHVEVDALGREKRIVFEERPQDGTSLRLTIDNTLQEKSEEILRQWMEKFNTTRGVVIISDPKTGYILSMVSLPSYDNNVFAKGISPEAYQELLEDEDRPLFHRALKGEYPSGSTIKPFIGAAALKEGIVDAKTTFLSSGGIRVGRWFFPDWKAGGHGVTNLGKALAESVNTYFYLIGGGSESVNGLGIERMADALRVFGFGAPTGIDLRGEENGFIPSPDWKIKTKGEPWYIGDTYHVAIGQGDVLVTPLQIHTATSLFANAGVAYQPMLVAALEDPTGRRVEQQPRIRTQEILENEHIQNIRDGMRRAVTEGSARRLSLLPVSAAGKTGTAQWHTEKKPHAWFSGWAPFEEPEVMITVLVEEGEEGSKSAIGVVYDILSWYFRDRQADRIDNE